MSQDITAVSLICTIAGGVSSSKCTAKSGNYFTLRVRIKINREKFLISVETNIYFGTNRISNIIRLLKIERIEYRILFAHQENIRILFEYLKIYSNKFAKNVKLLESKIFTYPENTFQSKRIFHILTLINKNYRSCPCSQNIVKILSLFLKNLSIFPSNNF